MSTPRRFLTRDGRSCNVLIVEATPESQPRHLSPGTSWLIFVTATEERLVAPAPAGWAEFTQLASLWERAAVVRRT
jgi:hypothetical protein